MIKTRIWILISLAILSVFITYGFLNRSDTYQSVSDFWVGEYNFEEYIPPNVGRLYLVTIYEDDGLYADIKVDGFQTLLRLKTKVEGNTDVIQFRFIDCYEEKDFNSINFSCGDILMKLENQKGELITSWNNLQPITSENEKQGVYFEKATGLCPNTNASVKIP